MWLSEEIFVQIIQKNSKGENFENWNFVILAALNLVFEKVALCMVVFQDTEKSFWKMWRKKRVWKIEKAGKKAPGAYRRRKHGRASWEVKTRKKNEKRFEPSRPRLKNVLYGKWEGNIFVFKNVLKFHLWQNKWDFFGWKSDIKSLMGDNF